MGQKIHPKGFRIGITERWDSMWFADGRSYAKLLHEDAKIRNYIKEKLAFAAVSKVNISRPGEQVIVDIYTARPGVVIGKRGSEVDRLKEILQEITQKGVVINIHEIKVPATNAQLIAANLAIQLEKRIRFRTAMKRAISQAVEAGAKGVKVRCKGRLGGVELARSEEYKRGKIPLHTLRASIDYGFAEAHTTYGSIGIKVWIYKGEILPQKLNTPSFSDTLKQKGSK